MKDVGANRPGREKIPSCTDMGAILYNFLKSIKIKMNLPIIFKVNPRLCRGTHKV
jgi:hypothetical protein